MTTEKAIRILQSFQEPEAWERQITQDAYDALQMAIDALEEKERQKDDGK